MSPHISRRDMLLSLPALAALPMASRLSAQNAKPRLQARALNHMTLSVSDVKRSLDFYQGLLGLPIQARQGNTVCLRIGDGPQFVALSQVAAGVAPHINHFCMTVDNFNPDRILGVLAEHGVTRADAAGPGSGPLKARVRMRGPEAGGAKEGTPELYFGDPDGIVVQLQDVTYCGGAGVLGNVCGKIEPSPSKGLLAVRDLSHFTIMGSNAQRSNQFYQDLFGFTVQANQGPAPLLGVGNGVQFVMFTGGGGGGRGAAPAAAATPPPAPRPPRIDHACLSLERFNSDEVLKKLTEFGIKPRGSAGGAAGPLVHYVTMRMENRGGAKEGTPELYFTDPDGIPIQLQDVRYCGGGGVLGDVCAS